MALRSIATTATMATSPIRSSPRVDAARSRGASAEREPERARPASIDAAQDPAWPPPLRRRTPGGAVPGAPRHAVLPPQRPRTDASASVRRSSERSPGAHASSPEPPNPLFDLTASAAPRTLATPAASLDAAAFDQRIGHPGAVRPHDVTYVEKVVDMLDRVARGESVNAVAAQVGPSLRDCFDSQGQLRPRDTNPPTSRLHGRLDRLAQGDNTHRDLHARFTRQMRMAGERFWNRTQRLMNVVMDACEHWARHPKMTKEGVLDAVLGPDDGDIRPQARVCIRKGGVSAVSERGNASVNALREAVETLAARGDDPYQGVVRRWRAFEQTQEELRRSLRTAGVDDPVSTYVAVLRALARGDQGISSMVGVIGNNSVQTLFNREGGFTCRGREYLERLRTQAPERARELEAASARTVHEVRDRVAQSLHGFALYVRDLRRGTPRQAALAAARQRPSGALLDARLRAIFSEHGTLQLSQSATKGLGTAILALHQSNDPAHAAAIEDLRAALLTPDHRHRAPDHDPLARLLESRAAAAGRRGRAEPSADWDVPQHLPPTPVLDLPPIDDTDAAASPPFSIPGLESYPATPELDLPPLDDAEAAQPSIGPTSAHEAGSTRPARDFSLIDQAAQRLTPLERLQLFDDIQTIDAHLASRHLDRIEVLLRDDPQHLLAIVPTQLQARLLRLLALMPL